MKSKVCGSEKHIYGGASARKNSRAQSGVRGDGACCCGHTHSEHTHRGGGHAQSIQGCEHSAHSAHSASCEHSAHSAHSASCEHSAHSAHSASREHSCCCEHESAGGHSRVRTHEHEHIHGHGHTHSCASSVLDDIGCGCSSCAVSKAPAAHRKTFMERALVGVGNFPVLYRIGAALVLAALGFVHPVFWIAAYLVAGLRVLLTSISRISLLDEHFLMSAASLGAVAIGEYPEAAAVMILFEVGEYFKDRAVDKSKSAISGLLAMRPNQVTLVTGGREVAVAPEFAVPGDILFVKVGERVALDGVVESDGALLDNSAVSGESMPAMLEKGDTVLSGAVVLERAVTVRITKKFEDSTISRIIALVENARERKTPTEQFVTKFSKIYTPLVVAAAVVMTVLPVLFLGAGAFSAWLHRSLIFLVVSCPCALVISVPLSYFAGIGRASALGILFKGSSYLEAISRADRIVFDKTGTLTTGEFKVLREHILDKNLYSIIYHIEKTSSHPVAAAITKYIESAYGGGAPGFGSALSGEKPVITEKAGVGLFAKFFDGTEIALGNEGVLSDSAEVRKSDFTCVYAAKNGSYMGHFELGDALRDDTAAAVKAISADMKISLLSGDGDAVTKSVAGALGIDNYGAGLLPEQKYAAVRKYVDSGETVVFVGDGINDAPVLAGASIGISMGLNGSDAAIEASDAVLMKAGISAIPDVVGVSKLTRRIVKENILLSLGIKSAVLVMGALGLANMWLAVLADVGAALIAVLNTLRISAGKRRI